MSVASIECGAMPNSSEREIDRGEEAAAVGVGPVGRLGVAVEIVRGRQWDSGTSVIASTPLRMLAQ